MGEGGGSGWVKEEGVGGWTAELLMGHHLQMRYVCAVTPLYPALLQNGRISFEEFVCGLAVLLHGSFSSKCRLLFQVFNIHGDEGMGEGREGRRGGRE